MNRKTLKAFKKHEKKTFPTHTHTKKNKIIIIEGNETGCPGKTGSFWKVVSVEQKRVLKSTAKQSTRTKLMSKVSPFFLHL